HRGDGPVKNMIDAVVLSCFFIGCQISGIFHHHNLSLIPGRIAADGTDLLIRQGAANAAVAHMLFCLLNGAGQSRHLLPGHVDNVKRQSLGGFRSDSREPSQLFNQFADMTRIIFHQNGSPPPSPPRPPVSLDIAETDSSSTFRMASFTAAIIRSSSISTSSGSTASGSM